MSFLMDQCFINFRIEFYNLVKIFKLKISHMKNNMGVWIDGSKAVIVNLANDSIVQVQAEIDNNVHHGHEGDKGAFIGGGRHVNNEKTFDERRKHQTDHYIKNVISELKTADSVFVFGPSEMKHHLKTQIENDRYLATRLSAVVSADKMTENQIIAAVKKHFTPVKI
jgi:hypothetical protein